MVNERQILVFGPAYPDTVLEIDRPLLANEPDLRLDQSLPAARADAREDGLIVLEGPTGDRLTFHLPPDEYAEAATFQLCEPVLARLLGNTKKTVNGDYVVSNFRSQLGGMGAGYAKALGGTLRMPLGRDEAGQRILRLLDDHGIPSVPKYVDYPTDTSLVILSSDGEKLAVGPREAMVRWRTDGEDRALLEKASALVFCGAPNVLMAEVLSWNTGLPVMCAPAMRNVCDSDFPLADMASKIDYLTLNELEWEHLAGKDDCRAEIPIISVTAGTKGSYILLRGGDEIFVPAVSLTGIVNANRAGETYGSTFFKTLLRELPSLRHNTQVDADIAARIGAFSARQAAKQLDIAGFAFPPDD